MHLPCRESKRILRAQSESSPSPTSIRRFAFHQHEPLIGFVRVRLESETCGIASEEFHCPGLAVHAQNPELSRREDRRASCCHLASCEFTTTAGTAGRGLRPAAVDTEKVSVNAVRNRFMDPFLHRQTTQNDRLPYNHYMETLHSVCALDCPDTCSLLVQVEDGRATRLRGDPGHPVTRGFLCGKVAQYLEREYSPQRLLYPQKRVGAKGEGRFTRISWDEALDTIAAQAQRNRPRLRAGIRSALQLRRHHGDAERQRHGPALLPSSGRFAVWTGPFVRPPAARPSCASLGLRYGTEPEQFTHSKFILVWGANIHGNNVHLWPFIVEARRKGAKLWVIDPVRTRTAALADRHLRIHPGSDLALALGLAHVILAENLHDADYVARHTNGFDELQLPRARIHARSAPPLSRASPKKTLSNSRASTRPRGPP